ncbi:MAG: TonB-dependent receptor, partial [Sphingomonadaceae bacterium]|nr:TonB-dependent receptor [Sphingomonadaceae bacterium]
RRETNLQRTPLSISVLSTQALSDRHVQALYDLADGAVPSLRVATFEARQSALTVGIRGIVPFDQNQTARDTGVGVYIDGSYLGRSQGLNAGLFDVERIEVLKGPQGTLFGRNTEGGAVSIVTRQPSGVFGLRAEAGYGNYGSYNGALHLDLPAWDNFSLKLDGIIEHQDPTVVDPLAGQTGWNYYNRVGGRAQLRWRPFDGFTWDVSADVARDENTPNYSQLVNYNPQGRVIGVYDPTTNRLVAPGSPPGAPTCSACIAPLSPLVVVTGDHRQSVAEIGVPQQPSVDQTHGFSSTIRYHLSPALELRSITAWRGVTTAQWDNSGGAHRTIFAPNANFSRYSLSNLRQNQFSQEFQAVGSIGHIDYTFGLYYFLEHARELAATPSSNRWNANGTGYTINSEIVIPPVTSGNQGWDYPGSWFVQRASQARAKSYAAYGQATWSPIDILHITLGGRWTRDERDGTLYTVSNVPTPYTLHYRNSRFDPMATLAVDLTPTVNVYARYATGYRAGGANDRSSDFRAFGPEAVKSYELGAHMDLLDRHVRLNVAGYIMDRTGTQIDFDFVDTNPFLPGTTIPNPTFNLHTENTANAPGVSKIRGLEADLTIRVPENLTLGASYAYTYTHIPLTPNVNPGPLFGVPTQVFVVYTPKNAASGSIDWHSPLSDNGTSLRIHLDAAYADPQYSFQNEARLTDSSFVVNGRIAIADVPMLNGAHVTFSLWSRNLLNETHIYRLSGANDAILGDYANFNPPRTFGGEIAVRF